MINKWETLNKKRLQTLKIFDVDILHRRHPCWDKESDFVVLNSASWVNIIPITKTGNVVLIKQYRHGIDDITLEIPGGLIEPNEESLNAAKRECLEETGYESKEEAVFLAEIFPNPAFLNNKCYSYVWNNCEKTKLQQLDGNEDIEVLEYPLEEIKNLINSKKIQHSLVLNAFFYFFLRNNII